MTCAHIFIMMNLYHMETYLGLWLEKLRVVYHLCSTQAILLANF